MCIYQKPLKLNLVYFTVSDTAENFLWKDTGQTALLPILEIQKLQMDQTWTDWSRYLAQYITDVHSVINMGVAELRYLPALSRGTNISVYMF